MLETLRQRDYRYLYDEVSKALNDYILKHKSQGWSERANQFSYVLAQTVDPEKSLLQLYEKTALFARSLRGARNYVGSLFFSDDVLSMLGSGSSLKAKLEGILTKYDPFLYLYLSDEVEKGPANYKTAYLLGNINYASHYTADEIHYLSSDSITILNRAVQDKELYDKIASQASGYQMQLLTRLMYKLSPAQKSYELKL